MEHNGQTAAVSTSAPAKASRLKRWPVRIARAAAVTYLGAIPLIALSQRVLVFPGSAFPAPVVAPPSASSPLSLKLPDGTTISGLFLKAFDSKGHPVENTRDYPTLLYFYGNGSCVAWSEFELDLFRRTGANVLVADYPGYASSGGSASEQGCYATADALWAYAMADERIDRQRVFIAGWSLGGAVAIDLAYRKPAAGLIVMSTFTSMEEMAHLQYPFLPTSLMLKYRFVSLLKMPMIKCPTLLYHGQYDTIVPAQCSKRLSAAAPKGLTEHTIIPNAGHNDIFATGYFEIEKGLKRLLAIKRPPISTP